MSKKKRKKGTPPQTLERKGEGYPVQDVLKHRSFAEVDFDGDLIKMDSQRYEVFDVHGHICVQCGLVGTLFFKEKMSSSRGYHFNLYGYLEDGTEVLMTKDHILPKCRGGTNTLPNYQTMCSPCNAEKGHSMPILRGPQKPRF